MPVSVEVKYEYFNTWVGRIKIIEVVSSAHLVFRAFVYVYSLLIIAVFEEITT